MGQDKEQLKKLLKFINQLTKQEGNEWFLEELQKKYEVISKVNSVENSQELISKVHEYCIKEIIKTQANKFYSDFSLSAIKLQLINDFIRMENFRREDDFENFSLAMFQQVENVVNYLATKDQNFINHINENMLKDAYSLKNKETQLYDKYKLWQLLFFSGLEQEELRKKIKIPAIEWEFSSRFKAILYYYHFNGIIRNFFDFNKLYNDGNELYQTRNLNHRGGIQTEKQKQMIEKILPIKHKYYYRFYGFLETFITSVNTKLLNTKALSKQDKSIPEPH